MPIPSKVRDRLTAGLKRLVPVIIQARDRDVSEADTVTIVKDLLADVFGYDKYTELTGEHAIRGTYCDLAVKLEEKIVQLIEVKSAGTGLDDRHVKQAVDYAANLGVEWVILTNASVWRLYQVIFAKPIDKRLLAEIDLTTLDARRDDQLDRAFLFSKEGFTRGAHVELRDRQDATSRYLLAALLTRNAAVTGTIRRELRRVVDVPVGEDEIVQVLHAEVIKRDTLEGPEAESAAKRVAKAEAKQRATKAAAEGRPAPAAAAPEVGPAEAGDVAADEVTSAE